MNWKLLSITTVLTMFLTLALATPAFAENVRQVGGREFGNSLENLSVESESHIEIPSINPESPATVEVENMYIFKLTIKVNEEVSNVGLTVQQLVAENFLPSGENFEAPGENFEASRENFLPPGTSVPEGFQNLGSTRTYKYFRFVTENLTDTQIENVIIEFAVEKSWISQYSIDEENITFGIIENKLVEITTPQGESITLEQSVTVDLPTEKVGEDATHIYFSTVSPGFSYFAITGGSEEGPSENSSGNGESSGGHLLGIAMMVIIILFIGVIFYWRKKLV